MGVLREWLVSFASILMDFVSWCFGLVHGLAFFYIELLVDACPQGMQADLTLYVSYLEYANHWLPIGEFLSMTVGVWIFQMSFAVIKIIVKLIPFGVG